MNLAHIALAALLAFLPLATAQAFDRVLPAPRIKDNGDVRLSDDLVIGRKIGDTIDLSGTRAARPGGPSRTLSDILDNSLDVRDFGAKDDDSTNNTVAVQAAINAATARGRTLHVTVSSGGSGKYRVGPSLEFKKVNVRLDEGASFVNLDGTPYTGASYAGFFGLPGVFDPSVSATGRRVSAPGRDTTFLADPTNAHETFTVYNGTAGVPYDVLSGERMYHLSGQSKLTNGSWSGQSVFANIYNHRNGPGFDISCQATNGSPVLTACTPSPTGTHEFTYESGYKRTIGNVFNPARLTSTTAGLPVGAYASSWDASTITIGQPGQFSGTANYTGATGRISINVVSGRSEFNTQSLQIRPQGITGQGGPDGGMNWYNGDDLIATNQSTDPADQEGFLTGREIVVRKNVPGNVKDILHNGSSIAAFASFPLDGIRSYTLDDGLAITGWSGPFGLSGGQDPTAGYAAFNGLRIGGGCHAIYCYASSRSYFKTGISVQDYETGMRFENPHSGFTGTAIFVAPGAGNIDVRDNLIVGASIIEKGMGTPAGPTAPCQLGQRSWDTNYEYRCVATNRWRRIAYSSDWP